MTPTEKYVYERLTGQGCLVFHDGWPDFLVVSPEGTIKFVEVKGNKDRLHGNQHTVHELLRTAGFDVEVVQFGIPGMPPIHLPKGRCPHCSEIFAVRKDGRPYSHVGYYTYQLGLKDHPEDDLEWNKTICPEEPRGLDADSQLHLVTVFMEVE